LWYLCRKKKGERVIGPGKTCTQRDSPRKKEKRLSKEREGEPPCATDADSGKKICGVQTWKKKKNRKKGGTRKCAIPAQLEFLKNIRNPGKKKKCPKRSSKPKKKKEEPMQRGRRLQKTSAVKWPFPGKKRCGGRGGVEKKGGSPTKQEKDLLFVRLLISGFLGDGRRKIDAGKPPRRNMKESLHRLVPCRPECLSRADHQREKGGSDRKNFEIHPKGLGGK